MATARQSELALAPTTPSREEGVVITARPYQTDTIEGVFEWWSSKPSSEWPVAVLPTAAGKTIIFSLLIKRVLQGWPSVRVLILAHAQELLEQAEQKLLSVWPEAETGVYCAGLGRREIAPVTIASRDSFVAADAYDAFDVVIVDEAHRIGREDTARYQQIIQRLTDLNPNVCGVGFTATPYRTDSGYIYGPDQMFRGVAYEATIRQLVKQGYLSNIRAAAVRSQIDTSGLRTSMGDYNQRQLGNRVADGDLLDRQLDEWEELTLNERQSTVFFCVNVQHAEMVARRLQERSYDAFELHGKTPKDERREIIEMFADGQLAAIANVGVLTEGWDCPRLDCIAILRPTKSLGLFIQMVGRGLRPSPETGKEDCLLLDFGGCLQRFGPIDRAKPAGKGRAANRELVKTCESCMSLCPIAASSCEHCGAEFGTVAKVCDECGAENRPSAAQCEACGALLMPDEVVAKPSTDAVFSDQKPLVRDVRCFEVDAHDLQAQTAKASGKRYLRISFYCGLETYSDIICLGYEGWAGQKAMRTMRGMLLEQYAEMPETDPDTFLGWHASVPGGMIKTPRAIYVDLASEWNDVTYVEYWTDEKKQTALSMQSQGSARYNEYGLRVDFDDDIPF